MLVKSSEDPLDSGNLTILLMNERILFRYFEGMNTFCDLCTSEIKCLPNLWPWDDTNICENCTLGLNLIDVLPYFMK